MIEKEKIETILNVNGVSPGSPDEEIRSVLLNARYSHDEVDTAIMVLRENTKTKTTRVDGLHKVFRTNESLTPEEISQLLGIEVSIDTEVTSSEISEKTSALQTFLVWGLSVAFGVCGVLGYMYLYQLGPFHPAFQQ